MHLIQHDRHTGCPHGTFQPRRCEIADADMADQFPFDQLIHRADGLFQRNLFRNLMIKIQIQIICSQPPQGIFRRTQHIIPFQMCFPDFGSQEQSGAGIARNGTPGQCFRVTAGIIFRRVDQGKSGFDSGLKRGNLTGVVIRRIAGLASPEQPGPHSQHRQ